MSISLEDVKSYLRVQHNLEDTFITGLINTAKILIKDETGVEYVENDEIYELLIKFIVQHYYNTRASASDKTVYEIPYTLKYLMCEYIF